MREEAIIKLSTVVDERADNFSNRLAVEIEKFQNEGLIVEIKFSTNKSQLSALVLGKRKNGYLSI